MNIASLRALFAKEFQHLVPLLIALLALEVLGLFDSFWAQSPDTLEWADLSILLDSGLAEVAATIYIFIGLIAAYMVLSHEGKQQTIQFLWSLPAKRWHIFAVKLITALLAMAGMILVGHLALLWVHSFSVGSVASSQFSWSLWWWEIAVLIGVTAIALGYGALVATFRVIGILVFLAAFVTVIVVVNFDPSLGYLSIGALLDLEFRGAETLLNARAWKLHAAVAGICAVLAALHWTRDGRAPADHSRATRIGVRIGSGLAVVVVVALVWVYGSSKLLPDRMFEGDEFGDMSLQNFATEHFEFSYYLADTQAAFEFISDADRYVQQAMELLSFDYGEKIIADLTDSSDTDHLGIAGWQKMRIKRVALYDEDWRTHVLVHETTHVLAAAASDRRLSDHYDYSMFFGEGIAEWVTFELLELNYERHSLRLLSALAWKRMNLRFSDFLFASSMRSQFDEGLVYAMGEAWVSTLAEVCGEQAPGAALHAMARPGAPQNLQGSAFWRDTLQTIDCDLGAVNSAFAQLMESHEEEIAGVPELSAAVSRQDNRLVVSLSLSESADREDYNVTVRVRDDANAPPLSIVSRTVSMRSGETIELDLPLRMISGQRFQYQVGLEFIPGQRPYYNRWIDEG